MYKGKAVARKLCELCGIDDFTDKASKDGTTVDLQRIVMISCGQEQNWPQIGLGLAQNSFRGHDMITVGLDYM